MIWCCVLWTGLPIACRRDRSVEENPSSSTDSRESSQRILDQRSDQPDGSTERVDWHDGAAVIRFLVERGAVASGTTRESGTTQQHIGGGIFGGCVDIPSGSTGSFNLAWCPMKNPSFVQVSAVPYTNVSDRMWEAIRGEWESVSPSLFSTDESKIGIRLLKQMQQTWSRDRSNPPIEPFTEDMLPKWAASFYAGNLYYDHSIDVESERFRFKVRVVDRQEELGSVISLDITNP